MVLDHGSKPGRAFQQVPLLARFSAHRQNLFQEKILRPKIFGFDFTFSSSSEFFSKPGIKRE